MRTSASVLMLGLGIILVSPGAVAGVHVVRTDALSAEFSEAGDLAHLTLAPAASPVAVRGGTRLTGCETEGAAAVQPANQGGITITKRLVHGETGARCTLTERVVPAGDSLRWEVEIRGAGEPWSAPIETWLRWPIGKDTRYWTAWSDPGPAKAVWNDPLTLMPWSARTFYYGAPPFDEQQNPTGYCPVHEDTFCIPMATVADAKSDTALSVVLSPEDDLLDLTLTTTRKGEMIFTRLNHRISAANPVRFAFDLTAHAADWRAALSWVTKRYPAYFNPPNPRAHDLAGCGAYSAYEGDLDAEQLRRMAFRVNWKASFDFPYMGLFLPPVQNDDETWPRFRVVPQPKVPPVMTSIRKMREYSERMRALGFHVLNYFNVTEFGTGLKGPGALEPDLPEDQVWKSANDLLYGRLADGVLYSETGDTWGTWGGAIAMDPAGPRYQAHLLEQARAHLDKLPDSDGICIDRLDWLRFYNPRADDGICWRNGRAYRSLFVSWHGIIGKLAPMMHAADKVVFVNNHLKRIDLLREIDGLYCEFAQNGRALNSTGLLCVRKPAIGWTASEADLQPSPDALFQRHLHLGVYPTAPYPENDHTIADSPWAREQYLDYGALLDAMRGKRWVLQPHVVEVTGGVAKVNLFEVPGGFVLPITFASAGTGVVTITLRRLPVPPETAALSAEILHPGEEAWRPLCTMTRTHIMTLEAPVQRGCAMVRLRLPEPAI